VRDLRAHYGPWALVAGASDGIGAAFAHKLAASGLNLVLLARRAPLLETLAGELRQAHGIETRTIVADLTVEADAERIRADCEELEIGLLIYNAGATHGAATFHDKPLESALALVELNCRMPLRLAHAFGAKMRARRRGGIVLLSSLASMSGGSHTAVYNATKSFDMILAEGLWHELKPHGVDAMCLMVGATRTPSMLASSAAFADYPGLMEPADVVAEALAFLGRGPMCVAGARNRAIVRHLLPNPRVAQINGLSSATAGIYGKPVIDVSGEDF